MLNHHRQFRSQTKDHIYNVSLSPSDFKSEAIPTKHNRIKKHFVMQGARKK